MDQEITKEHIDQVLEQVTQIAAMADYNVKRVPDKALLVAGFEMGEGRRQMVYIRYVGQTPNEQDVISFDSPCMHIKKGWLRGMGKDRALDLLRRNSQLLFGHFALETFDDSEVLVVASSQIVQTMEMEEFEAHIRAVALIADQYEAELGKDEF